MLRSNRSFSGWNATKIWEWYATGSSNPRSLAAAKRAGFEEHERLGGGLVIMVWRRPA
jgi:hypothetical protein